jgi:hypothetical protein
VIVATGAAVLLALGTWATIAASLPAGPEGRQARPAPVEVFTFVETGIVYVDPVTSEIVWQDEQREMKTIGEQPWRNPEPTDPEVPPIRPWALHRDIVGNPDHDVVVWVETADGRRGDMVVVEAHTGEVLARTPVPGDPDASVVISSVDDEAVYFAVADRNWPFPDVDSDFVRIWRWADGEEPEPGFHSSTVYFNDLSAGVSAIYGLDGVLFETAERVMRSTTRPGFPGRTDFGGALSPDGRFWYGAETSRVTETATGEAIELPTAVERSYGWTGAAELSLTVCEPGTGKCQTHTCELGQAPTGAACAPGLSWSEAANRNPTGLCLPYGLACGSRMPVS